MEHVFPLEIHSRLKGDPYLCVASLGSGPSKQCKVRRPSAPDWIFKKLSACNTDVTYSELLTHIGSLVQAVMCRPHYKTVLSGPSIVEIQKIVSDQAHLSNEDCSYLRAWSEPYQPKLSERISVPEALRQAISRPLRASDHADGYIYIYCMMRTGLVK
jgi:hypothetical protein